MTGLLLVAAAFLLLALFGLATRSGLLFQLLAVELALAGAALAFVAAGAFGPGGLAAAQAMVLIVLAIAAAEAGLGFALYLALSRVGPEDDTDRLDQLHD